MQLTNWGWIIEILVYFIHTLTVREIDASSDDDDFYVIYFNVDLLYKKMHFCFFINMNMEHINNQGIFRDIVRTSSWFGEWMKMFINDISSIWRLYYLYWTERQQVSMIEKKKPKSKEILIDFSLFHSKNPSFPDKLLE